MEPVGQGQLIRFGRKNASTSIVTKLVSDLKSHGILAEKVSDEALLVRASKGVLEVEASHAMIQKPLVISGERDEMVYETFDVQARGLYAGVDESHFFTPAEVNWLSDRILYSIKVGPVVETHYTRVLGT
jgi:hypothetical protein